MRETLVQGLEGAIITSELWVRLTDVPGLAECFNSATLKKSLG